MDQCDHEPAQRESEQCHRNTDRHANQHTDHNGESRNSHGQEEDF
jgi:hypothetical protein